MSEHRRRVARLVVEPEFWSHPAGGNDVVTRPAARRYNIIEFTSFDPPAGTLDLRIRGRVCGEGVN